MRVRGSRPLVCGEGGTARLIERLVAAAGDQGVELRTSALVRSIRVAQGRVVGVALESGEEIEAAVVAASCDPKQTLLELVHPRELGAETQRGFEVLRARGGAAKVHLALAGELEFAARPGERFAAALVGGGDLDQLERASDAIKYRQFSERPFLEVRIPSVQDPSLAPEGHHVVSILSSFAPYELKDTDLVLRGDKPAVFTGAQRTHDDPHPDGPRNILSALRTAASPAARGLGALLCFNDRIHAARDVTKVHASAVETFQSYGRGALGEVDGDRVVIHRRPCLRRTFEIASLEDRVHLVRLFLGVDIRLIDALVDAGIKGLVIEAFGRGNGPSALTAAVRRAVDAGVIVVVTSRCPEGRVEPIYGGGGGGRDLEDAGALFAGDLKGPKARILLMVLLSDPETRTRVADFFAELAP